MNRCIVTVATGDYVRGQSRILASTHLCANLMAWAGHLPEGSPPHRLIPYAFKAYALSAAKSAGYRFVMWLDASILPLQSMEPIWNRIERDGYWIPANVGYSNYRWTGLSAYADLGVTEDENKQIQHVVSGAYGMDLHHPIGAKIFDEVFRLANTNAHVGPWWNVNGEAHPAPAVEGHRHDQTALSVVAHRLGCELTRWPDPMAYKGREDSRTILLADGVY